MHRSLLLPARRAIMDRQKAFRIARQLPTNNEFKGDECFIIRNRSKILQKCEEMYANELFTANEK